MFLYGYNIRSNTYIIVVTTEIKYNHFMWILIYGWPFGHMTLKASFGASSSTSWVSLFVIFLDYSTPFGFDCITASVTVCCNQFVVPIIGQHFSMLGSFLLLTYEGYDGFSMCCASALGSQWHLGILTFPQT